MTIESFGIKVGRNDKCPCGSGKKYKKCCLPLTTFDCVLSTADENRHYVLVEMGRADRIEAMKQIAETVIERCRQREGWDGQATPKSESIKIKLINDEISVQAARVLIYKKHSRQYWFQLIRRWTPLLWEELETLSQAETSAEWQGEVTKGAGHLVLSYALDGDPWEWVDEQGVCGIDYRGLAQDELLVAAQILSLAQLRYEANVRFRYTCKGFRAFGNSKEVDALASQNTASIQRYEERRASYDTLAGSAGLWYDPANFIAQRSELCLWFGLSVVRSDDYLLRSQSPQVEIGLRYLFLPMFEPSGFEPNQSSTKGFEERQPFVPYDCLIQHPRLRAAFESAFHCEAEQLVVFLYAAFRFVSYYLRFARLDFCDNRSVEIAWLDEPDSFRSKVLHRWLDVGALGLLRTNRADWIEGFLVESLYLHSVDKTLPELSREVIDKFISEFTWKPNMPCYGNRPKLFTELSTHTLVLDGFSACDFLRHVLLSANLDSKDDSRSKRRGDVTGGWLETQASEYFIRQLDLLPKDVVTGRELSKIREVDIAFVVNRSLFVIDCKAMAKDAAFMEGQHEKIRNRATQILEELTLKNPQRIALIRAGVIRDIIDPQSFDHAFSLVCTSAVEYLPVEVESYWCCNVPLVGPPNELLRSIRLLSKSSGHA